MSEHGISNDVVLDARAVVKTFPIKRDLLGRPTQRLVAVDEVDLVVHRGEAVGIVGESGSGKTTLGRVVAHLEQADSGTIEVAGRAVGRSKADQRWLRRQVQMVFQDPFSSLDPTKTVRHAIREPLVVQKIGDRRSQFERVDELLDQVGLLPVFAERYPEELSGGQRQRVAIARALAPNPPLLIADEPTSALDLSTRSEILNLLLELQESTGLAIAVISHDFATIRHISHRIVVMYMGVVVEEGPADDIASRPKHPYTQALMSAVPGGDPTARRLAERIVLRGPQPNPINLPVGCRFQSRCPHVMDRCREIEPPLMALGESRFAACHLLEGEAEAVAVAAPLAGSRGVGDGVAERQSLCDPIVGRDRAEGTKSRG